MTDLPFKGNADSMDNVAVTREQFRQDIGEFLEYAAQALGGVTGSYATASVDPLAVVLQGAPTLLAAAEPAANDSSLRIPSTQWVKRNGGNAGSTAPTTPVDGQIWVDISTDPPTFKIWDDTASAWIVVGATPADASETVKGIVELATSAETEAGTDNTRAVHPAGLKAALDLKLSLAGGTLTGPLVTRQVTSVETAITTGAFNLALGNFWHVGAIAVPNPTNAVAGMSGLIRLTAAPTGWGTHFSTAPAPTVFPSIVPFYVESATSIRLGPAVGVA